MLTNPEGGDKFAGRKELQYEVPLNIGKMQTINLGWVFQFCLQFLVQLVEEKTDI